jgi:putative membrane protein
VIRWLLAAAHLLALGIGLGAVWARGRALRAPLDDAGLRRVFAADAWWGLAALVWISSGLWRLLGGLEKATSYYLHNHIFLSKMTLLAVVLVLEVWPMTGLIARRRRVARGERPDTRSAPLYARISLVQAGLIILMVFAATAMARGYGA